MIPSISNMLEADRYQILAILIVLLLPSPAVSITPAPPPPVSDFPNPYGNIKPQFGLVVLIITAFIFFLAFFSLCVRHCGNRSPSSVSAVVVTARTRRGHHGLDPAVLQTFPIFDYSAVKEMKIGKGALECAVCLSEFEDDETLRFIPKCDHVFHAECIDTWLESHATCPVCRANLVPVPGESFDLPVLGPSQPRNQNDNVSIHVESETMEQPLNARARMSLIRSRTRGMSGRRRWFGLFLRSNSTGHVEVNHAGDTERFTLRLPADLRRQIIGGKLSRTTSCLAPATEVGSRVENRVGFGGSYNEGSSQGQGRLGGRFSKADLWVFSVTRPFAQPALPPV